MSKWIRRLGYGLLFAIPLMLITYALAYASEGVSANEVPVQELRMSYSLIAEGLPDCATCHKEVVEAWSGGYHSQALEDPIFNEAWESQGKPGECLECHVTGYDLVSGTWEADGISCIACHPTISEGHPIEPADVNHSPDLCGNCHTDMFFEWQASVHGQKGIACVNCHNPHGNELKMESPEKLCSACHRTLSEEFAHSQHNLQGLTCIDCHMAEMEGDPNHPHKDHSFYVGIKTCNNCHSNQLHNPGLFQPQENNLTAMDAMASVEDIQVSGVPKPVNPTAFAILAGLVGIGIGIAIAPWFENRNRKKRDA